MTTFTAKAKTVWASRKDVSALVDTLVQAWEGQDLAQVIPKAQALVEDAKTGNFTIDGKTIYIVELLKQFTARGLEIPKPNTTTPSSVDVSKYS